MRYKVCNVKAVAFGSPTMEVIKHRCVHVDVNVIVIVRMMRSYETDSCHMTFCFLSWQTPFKHPSACN